jgi:hypothetical protein
VSTVRLLSSILELANDGTTAEEISVDNNRMKIRPSIFCTDFARPAQGLSSRDRFVEVWAAESGLGTQGIEGFIFLTREALQINTVPVCLQRIRLDG